jgi:hypothetical protein
LKGRYISSYGPGFGYNIAALRGGTHAGPLEGPRTAATRTLSDKELLTAPVICNRSGRNIRYISHICRRNMIALLNFLTLSQGPGRRWRKHVIQEVYMLPRCSLHEPSLHLSLGAFPSRSSLTVSSNRGLPLAVLCPTSASRSPWSAMCRPDYPAATHRATCRIICTSAPGKLHAALPLDNRDCTLRFKDSKIDSRMWAALYDLSSESMHSLLDP